MFVVTFEGPRMAIVLVVYKKKAKTCVQWSNFDPYHSMPMMGLSNGDGIKVQCSCGKLISPPAIQPGVENRPCTVQMITPHFPKSLGCSRHVKWPTDLNIFKSLASTILKYSGSNPRHSPRETSVFAGSIGPGIAYPLRFANAKRLLRLVGSRCCWLPERTTREPNFEKSNMASWEIIHDTLW